MAQFEVTFCVSGHVKQIVDIPGEMAADELARKLESGQILTTIQEGGAVISTADLYSPAMGTVLDVMNHCEYEYFEVKEIGG